MKLQEEVFRGSEWAAVESVWIAIFFPTKVGYEFYLQKDPTDQDIRHAATKANDQTALFLTNKRSIQHPNEDTYNKVSRLTNL